MKNLKIIILCIIAISTCIIVWFRIPYSPLKKQFEQGVDKLKEHNNKNLSINTFSEEILATKPRLLREYIKYCNLENKPMMTYSITTHKNVDFLLNRDKPMVKIDYIQANFANIYERIAFIDTNIYGLPFQGLDDNIDGIGKMKGVIAKLFTIFNVKGREMDQASLVTVLAEGIVCPSFLMNDDIIWEEIDDNHLKATLEQYGIKVSGIFEFDNNGAIISFYSKDRYQESNGVYKQLDWKAECNEYKEIDGIKRPTVFKGAWIYDEGEEVYFNCEDVNVQFYY